MARFRLGVRAVTLCTAVVTVFVLTAIDQQARAGTMAPVAKTAANADIWIAAEANFLSDRQLVVTCVPTAHDWDAAVATAGFSPEEGSEIFGFSLIHAGAMYLSPYVCEGLKLGVDASTRRANELQVAWSVNVLVHESAHMGRFTFDEALTEACARAGLPIELHRLYGIAYRSSELSRLTLAATYFRDTMSAAYQGGTCTAPA